MGKLNTLRFEPQRNQETHATLAWGRQCGQGHERKPFSPQAWEPSMPHPISSGPILPDPSPHHLHAGSPQQHSSLAKLPKFRPPGQRLPLEPRELWSFHSAERLYASFCHSSFCSRKTRGRSYSQAVLGLKDVKPEQVPLASGFVFFKLGFSNRRFFF